MNYVMQDMPGLDAIRERFRDMLVERQADIARNTLAAWDAAQNGQSVRLHLVEVRNALHKIAGTAGSLGYRELGDAAFAGEHEIIAHFEKGEAMRTTVTDAIINAVDDFVAQCEAVMTEAV